MHQAEVFIVAGHYDCDGNPVRIEEHRRQVKKCFEIVMDWGIPVARIIAALVNEDWEIDVVCEAESLNFHTASLAAEYIQLHLEEGGMTA